MINLYFRDLSIRFLLCTLFCSLSLISGGATARAQLPLNLTFEKAGVSGFDRPWGWSFGWSAFASGSAASFELDSTVYHGGRRSLRIAMKNSNDARPQSIMLQLPASFALGRSISLSGWIRSDKLRGKALLTLEAWKNMAFASADTAEVIGSGGLQEWTQYTLLIRIPSNEEVHSVVITAILEGQGTVWFDDLELRMDGVLVTALPMDVAPPSATELAWLRRHATPLNSVEVSRDTNDTDLLPFADIVGDARIVALGESTHGTREFFLVKHRLLEFLVRRLGFTVFAIEANQLATEQINRYVQGGDGTAQDAMRVMFSVWNTEEMLSLVEWIRAYNLTHSDNTIRFAGYDMQDYRTPADTLRAFLSRIEPTLLTRFDELAGEYRAQRSSTASQSPDSTRKRWHMQAETLWSEVSSRRGVWLARASNATDSIATEWAVQAANLFRQAAGFNETLNSPERDSLMASNLDWLLRTLAPGRRTLMWAHDVHVSRGGKADISFNGGRQMGAYLTQIYGNGYRAFSLLTYQGSYSATRSFTDHNFIVAPAFDGPANSIEGALHTLGCSSCPGFIVDLRSVAPGDAGSWLLQPRPIRHIGYAAYDYGFELRAVLPIEFDGVVFIDSTTPTRLLQR